MENLKEKLTQAILDAMVADGKLLQIKYTRYMSINPGAFASMEHEAALKRSEAMQLVENLIDEIFKEAKDGA